jgi:hypothetical protein
MTMRSIHLHPSISLDKLENGPNTTDHLIARSEYDDEIFEVWDDDAEEAYLYESTFQNLRGIS